jgi:hypothetical protein
MRTKFGVLFVSVFAMTVALVVTGTSSSQAAGAGVDLAMTGHTVAGYTSAQAGQELPVAFTMTNHSSTTSADIAFAFTVGHATTDDITCPLVSNHFNINPDGPFCEPGTLGPGKSTSAAIMVTAASIGTVTVRACATLLDSHTDPVARNNCRTVSIPIE